GRWSLVPGQGHEKTYHHRRQERHSFTASSQSPSTQRSTMDPPRRPGGRDDEPRSHWVDPGYCKYYPGTAPTPHPSKITSTYLASTLLVQRQQQQQQQQQHHHALANKGEKLQSYAWRVSLPQFVASNNNSDDDGDDGESNDPNSPNNNNQDAGAAATATDNAVDAARPRTKRKNPEKVDDGDRCPICQDLLPEENRGILKCGHLFCLKCILQWVKKQQNNCPTCRAEVCHIKRTLSLAEALEKNANRKPPTKAQLKRAKRKSAIGKPSLKPDITTEKVRVRKKVSRERIRQNAMAPHPQAPGGFLHAQEQAEATAGAAQAVPDTQPDQVEDIMNQQVAIAVFSSSPPLPSATPQVHSPLPPWSPPSPAADREDRRVPIVADRRALFESTSACRGHRSVGGGSYVGGDGGARSIGDNGGGIGASVGEASLDMRMKNHSGGGGDVENNSGGGGAVGGRGWRSTVHIGNSSSGVSSDGGGVGSGNRDADDSNSRNNNGVGTGGAAEAAAQASSSNRDVQGAATSSGGDNLDHDDDDDDGRGDGVGDIATLGHLLSVLCSGTMRVSPNGDIGGIDGGGCGIASAAPSSVSCSPLLPSSSSSNKINSSSNKHNNSISNSSHGVGNPATDPETRSAAQAAMAASRAASRYTSLVPEQALAVQGLAALESSPTLRQLRVVARLVVGGSASAGMAGTPAVASVSRRRQPQDRLDQESGKYRDDEAGVSGRGDGGKSNSEERGSLLPRMDIDDNRSDNISSRGGGIGAEEEPCIEPVARRTAAVERDVSHTEEGDEYTFLGRNDNNTSTGGTTGSASPILGGSSDAVACSSSTSIPESSAYVYGNNAVPSGSINDGANTAVAGGAENAYGGDANGTGVAGCGHAGGGISVSTIGAAGPGGVTINSGRVRSSSLNNNNNNNNTCSYLTWLESRSDFNHWPWPSSSSDDDGASD
ncbi:unnamed protein product, partial [Ectocarpus sp. 12 AP-2014]